MYVVTFIKAGVDRHVKRGGWLAEHGDGAR
jgi:hypothetical protein